MNKKDVQKRVLKNGKPLPLKLFTWDENTYTFSSDEDFLVIDFNGIYGGTFNAGSGCTFNTGSGCTFNTRSYCTFNTGSDCTFETGFGCTFNTGSDCRFYTGSGCTFNTGSDCTFNTWSDCTFNTGLRCVVVRRDVFEVIELKEGQKIKLNGYQIRGYQVLA